MCDSTRSASSQAGISHAAEYQAVIPAIDQLSGVAGVVAPVVVGAALEASVFLEGVQVWLVPEAFIGWIATSDAGGNDAA
jgi:hypothetical protein